MAWNLTGNSEATTSSFLGTTNVQPLIIKTNSSEAMRITTDGKVSISNLGGPRSPDYRLDVQGILNADEIYKGGAPLVQSQWTTVGGGITYEGGEVGIGARVSGYRLNVDGVINATDVHKGGTPLVGSQWEDGESGGINYSGSNVGIGTINASYKLNVGGAINASEYRRNGTLLVGSQWIDVSGIGIRYNSYVGLGKAPATPYRLDVAGTINATDIHKNGKPLVESQWTGVSGGINYTGGSVGIGIAPQSKVHISSAEPQLRLDTTGSRATVQLAKDGAVQWDFGVGQGATGNNDFWFGDMTSYRLVLQKATGNVGIGTVSPAARLSVAGGGATVNGVAIGTDVPGIDYPYEYETVGVTNTNYNLRLQSPNSIVFHTGDSPTDRMSISEGGDLIIKKFPANDTTPSLTKIGLQSRSSGGNTVEWAIYTAAVGGGWGVNPNGFEIWEYPATQARFRIRSGGDVTIPGRVGILGWPATPRTSGWGGGIHTWDVEAEGTMWSQSGYKQGSDARIKANVAKLSNVLDKLEAIRGVSFERIESHTQTARSAHQRNIGVIAQEVEEVFPELVSEHGDKCLKAVDYSGLTGILVEATKDLKSENEALKKKQEAENDEWRSAMDELRARIEALEHT